MRKRVTHDGGDKALAVVGCAAIDVGQTEHDRVDALGTARGDVGDVRGDHILCLGLGASVDVGRLVRRVLGHGHLVRVAIHLGLAAALIRSSYLARAGLDEPPALHGLEDELCASHIDIVTVLLVLQTP